MKSYGINVDLYRDVRLSEQSRKLLKSYYLADGESSPQEAFARAAVAYCDGDMDLAQRIYDYVSKGWFMYSSPILSNAPKPGEKHVGLPISCFLSYVPDTIPGITSHHEETAWLSVKGGGVGGHWDDVRGVTEKSPGVIPMLKVTDAQMTAFKQGKTRKGSYAAYLDIDHPDIVEFINFKVPTGGDTNRKCFNLFNAVNVTDDFMDAVDADGEWELKCPNTRETVDTVRARTLWERIIEVRFRTGSPYINFIDTANKALPEFQKRLGLKIHGSNLCNEIHLATDDLRTAVCCLSSINLEFWDDICKTPMIEDLIEYLDNVLQEFINEAPDALSRAKYSAERERSLGLGAMGFHGLLMKRGIPWESEEARRLNKSIFSRIKDDAMRRTMALSGRKGEAPDAKNFHVRNSHLLAIAPNANSSILCNCTASIEPLKANVFTHRTRVGADVVKNPYLEKELRNLGKNTEEVWASIMQNEGSVQHLDFLSDKQKDIYKTSFELDQGWVVQHAADRQVYICQGQSVNLFFRAGASRSYVNGVHIQAWRQGLKGLYYLRTTAGRTADKVGQKVERVALKDHDRTVIYGKKDCPWCDMAKKTMSGLNLTYQWFDLDVMGKTAAEVTGRDVTTVPQIYIEGNYVGGYEGLREYFGLKGLEWVVKQENIYLNVDEDEECVSCQG